MKFLRNGGYISKCINEKDWISNGLGSKGKELELNILQYNPMINLGDLTDYDTIILGGSESNISTDEIPWISKIKKEIRVLEKTNVKLFGICFGHQLIAYSYGCKIKRLNDIQFGIKKFSLTHHAQKIRSFMNCPISFHAYFSHFDIVDEITSDVTTTVLDSNSNCYGLSIGQNIHGLQFHPEIPKAVILSMLESKIDLFHNNEYKRIREELEKRKPDIQLSTFLSELTETKVANNV